MTNQKHPNQGRRRALRTAALLPLSVVTGTLFVQSLVHAAPTPECRDNDEPTPRQTEGPFYKPQSPQRTSLIDNGMQGGKLVVSGRVLSTGCEPIAGALLDFWHCDSAGRYDLRGQRFRGHQVVDADGAFRLETIHPGKYPGRARHIHVKVLAPNGKLLTTQLYFPGEADNEDDWIYTPKLAMQMPVGPLGNEGRFNFVLDVG